MAASVFLDANIVLEFLLKRKDYEDALQYYTALHHKIDFFISADRKFQKQALTLLPVYSLPQFLKLFT